MIPIIDAEQIRPHLTIEALIPAAEEALRAISAGTAKTPLFILHPNDWSDIHVKSAALPGCPIFTVKMAGWSEKLADKGQPASSGIIAVFDSETCKPIAILNDDHLISDYRTAAAGAVAANLFVRKDAQKALVMGTGAQAYLQIKALLAVRPVKNIQVWGRDTDKASRLADRLREDRPDLNIDPVEDLPQAVSDADVIITATAAKEPLLKAEWVRPGQHITSVGSDDATKCELDPEIPASVRVFVDSKTSAEAFGTTKRALDGGMLTLDSLVEIGTVLEEGGFTPDGRATAACLTGLGVQDLTAVNHIWHSLNQGR